MKSLFQLGRFLGAFALLAVARMEQAQAEPIITGTDLGTTGQVRIFDTPSQPATRSFPPYPLTFTGGVRVAAGDVTGDGVLDIITAPGPGVGSNVKVFDGVTGGEVRSFLAFEPNFSGGVFVAAGDIDGDGSADIIAGQDQGSNGGARVRVFRGTNLDIIASFLPYGVAFNGGVRVAAGDVNGDGQVDIITGAGSGSPLVRGFHGRTQAQLFSFLAYPAGFSGGVYVAAGDFNGDGGVDVITGAGPGAGPHVKVFSGRTRAELRSFFAYEGSFNGGVRVAAGDVNNDGRADLIVAPGPGRNALVKTYNGTTGTQLHSFLAYDQSYSSGLFVASSAESITQVRTDPATGVTASTATLNGTVDPNGRTVTVRFQYGLTTSYGTTVDAIPPTVSGTEPTEVSANIAGLQPGRTYHFRAIALDGIGGTVVGNDRTFSTVQNIPPVGGTFTVTPNSPVPSGTVLTATFAGWTDVDGHTPLRYEVREGPIVIVPITPDETSQFILPAGTHTLRGRVYDILGAFTETDPVDVIVEGDPDSEARFVTREPVPGAGSGGIPEGAVWSSFGVPAIADGSVKFLANFRSSTARGGGVFSDGTPVALIGEAVPGAGAGGQFEIPAAAIFKSFKDPVTDPAGHVAFIATMKGEGVTAANDTIVVSNGRTGALEVIAREGFEAPGGDGAKFAAFQGVSIGGSGVGGTIFTARLGRPAGAANNLGAWWLPSGGSTTVLLVREGQLGFAEGEIIKSFALLQNWPGTPGHGRGQVDGDEALLQVTLSGGRQAQVRATPDALTLIAKTGDSFGDGSIWLGMAQPSADNDGQTLSVRGTFRSDSAPATSPGRVGIMTSTDAGATWSVLTAVGEIAAGIDAVWIDLGYPVTSGAGDGVAFLGRMRGVDVTPATDSGVAWVSGTGGIRLLAREGSQAVGCKAGERFRVFRSLAYPVGGPLFAATLAGPTVNPGNDQGVWAVDGSGSLRLVFREGQKIGAKKVQSFTVLSVVSGSPGVTRAFNDLGQVTWRARFTDGTSGIIVTQIPQGEVPL